MSTNARPNSSDTSSPPTYKLYPVKAVTWATAFGSPLAGGIILAVNFRRLSQDASKRRAIAWSIVATIALFTLVFLIPEDASIPNAVFVVPQLVAMHFVARSLQGAVVDAHVSQGGALASVWNAVGIGVVCLAGILVAVVGAAVLIAPYELDPMIKVNINDEVFYSDGATRDDAVLVGRLLTESEYFGDPAGASVTVSVSEGTYSVAFVLVDDAWEDPEVVEWMRGVGTVLAEGGLGRPLRVELCDDNFESHAVVEIEECNNVNLVVDSQASGVQRRGCWQVEYVVDQPFPAEELLDRTYRTISELGWQKVDEDPSDPNAELHSWSAREAGDSKGTVIEQWYGMFEREDQARLMVLLRYFGREGSKEPQPVLTSVTFVTADQWESRPH